MILRFNRITRHDRISGLHSLRNFTSQRFKILSTNTKSSFANSQKIITKKKHKLRSYKILSRSWSQEKKNLPPKYKRLKNLKTMNGYAYVTNPRKYFLVYFFFLKIFQPRLLKNLAGVDEKFETKYESKCRRLSDLSFFWRCWNGLDVRKYVFHRRVRLQANKVNDERKKIWSVDSSWNTFMQSYAWTIRRSCI